MYKLHEGTEALVEERPGERELLVEEKKEPRGRRSPEGTQFCVALWRADDLGDGRCALPGGVAVAGPEHGWQRGGAGNRAGGLWHPPNTEHAPGWLALRSPAPAPGDANRGRSTYAPGRSPGGAGPGGHPTLWQLCAIAVPLGAFGGAFLPASQSIVPETLSPDELQAGNGLMLASRQGANLIGAAGAGVVLAAVSAAVALAIDAGTFLVSALSLALMRTTHRAAPGTGKQAAIREQETAGVQDPAEQISLWQYLRASRLIQGTLLVFIVIGLVSGGLIEVALPALVHGHLHGNASGFGLILAAWGAGALGGAIGAGALGKRQHKGLIMLLAGLLMAAMIALLPTWGEAFAVVCMLLVGFAGSIVNVVLFTAVQLDIPRHLMGRVMSLLLFGSFGVYPLSVTLAGVLSDHLSPASFFPVSGLLLALAMLLGLTQRALRDI